MNRNSRAQQLLLGLALAALTPLLLGFLCYPLVPPSPTGVVTPTPAALFAPTVSANVSNPTPGVPSNIELRLAIPAVSTLAIGATFDVPTGWTVADDAGVADGSRVGSIAGFMTVDNPVPLPFITQFGCNTTVSFDPTADPPTDIKLLEATTDTTTKVSGADTDGNGKPDVLEDGGNGLPKGVVMYPALLNMVLPPVLTEWGATVKARYFGFTEAAGISDLYVNVIVTQLAPGGPYRVLIITNDPTSRPEAATNRFCAPQSLTLTLFGTSADNPATVATEGGEAVYTNPPQGEYTFTAALVSEFDHDNDGASNGSDNCPFTPNANQADTDEDYLGDACDDPAPTPNFDVDGDGIENGYDNCMFVPNSTPTPPNLHNQLDSDFDDIGDACDPDVGIPNGPNYYLSCTDPVGIGQADPGGASCVQGTPSPLVTPTATPSPNGVGGIAELPEVAGTPLEADRSSGLSLGLLAGIAAAVAVVLGAAAWYARRRGRG